MQVLILIEPTQGGRFRAKAGEPFGVSTEAETVEEATQHLKSLLHDLLRAGSRLAFLDLGNGLPPTPFHLEPLPEDDWFFQTMSEAIAANRRREDEGAG